MKQKRGGIEYDNKNRLIVLLSGCVSIESIIVVEKSEGTYRQERKKGQQFILVRKVCLNESADFVAGWPSFIAKRRPH